MKVKKNKWQSEIEKKKTDLSDNKSRKRKKDEEIENEKKEKK